MGSADHAPGSPVKIVKAEEKKEEEKKEEEEATILTEPAKAGELSIFVESKIGMPGDKIMVDGEMNEVAPDAKDAKEPPEPPAKKGAEIKLVLPLSADHAPGSPVKIVKAEEKKEEEKKKEEKK